MIKDSVLIDFILDNHTPLRAKLTLEAIETSLTYNVLDIIPRLEEVILNDDIDTMTRIVRLKSELITSKKEILRHVGIIPYQNIDDFVIVSKVLSALDKSVNEYYPDYILENTLLDDENEDDLSKLHSLVNLIEGVSEINFYDTIHSVSETMIPELLMILKSKIVEDIETMDPSILVRYREFINGQARGVIYEYIKSGGVVGEMGADAALALFTQPILDLPIALRPFDIASALLITNASNEEIRELIPSWAQYFTDTDTEFGIVEREINEIL